ncbi:MAG: hypothetical protein ACE141_14370 [Bryobacteraceae bacterium]
MENGSLVTISQFRLMEPAFSSDQSVYAAARQIQGFPIVRVGRRVFIDLERWREFKRAGGQALPGGWRREPVETRG